MPIEVVVRPSNNPNYAKLGSSEPREDQMRLLFTKGYHRIDRRHLASRDKAGSGPDGQKD